MYTDECGTVGSIQFIMQSDNPLVGDTPDSYCDFSSYLYSSSISDQGYWSLISAPDGENAVFDNFESRTENNLNSDDVAYLVPHQANKRIIDATAKRMGVGPEKVLLNIEKYGNTTAATIPLCLWDFEKKFKKGDNLILAAFGGGFTWGSLYLKWSYNN